MMPIDSSSLVEGEYLSSSAKHLSSACFSIAESPGYVLPVRLKVETTSPSWEAVQATTGSVDRVEPATSTPLRHWPALRLSTFTSPCAPVPLLDPGTLGLPVAGGTLSARKMLATTSPAQTNAYNPLMAM